VTNKEKTQQQRFFCDNCQREVFLQAKYCDNCGGEIEWPEEVKKVLDGWKKEEKKDH
jgi:predicted amidophosphoribosyltransferase